jgi:hypothetical protein
MAKTATDGFFFALHLVESLGVVYDRPELLRRLRGVARGEISVFNSPQEELEKLEAEKGRGTDEEREEFIRGFHNRGGMDIHLRLTAVEIVEVLESDSGFGWPT